MHDNALKEFISVEQSIINERLNQIYVDKGSWALKIVVEIFCQEWFPIKYPFTLLA